VVGVSESATLIGILFTKSIAAMSSPSVRPSVYTSALSSGHCAVQLLSVLLGPIPLNQQDGRTHKLVYDTKQIPVKCITFM
jgi:hypothetical protein